MFIDKIMNKMNSNSLNREQLDIIKKYNDKDNKLIKYIVYLLISELMIDWLLDHSKVSSFIVIVIGLILIAFTIYYIYFKITKIKHVSIECKKIKYDR